MEIQNLNDVDLLQATKAVVQREREILIEVLHHLREVDRRRLYSVLKYRSLYEYATKELGYSEDQSAHQTKLARENRTAQLRNWPCPIFRATLSGCVV